MEVEFRLIVNDDTIPPKYKSLHKATMVDVPRVGDTVAFPNLKIKPVLEVMAVHWDIYDEDGNCDVVVDVMFTGKRPYI